MFDTGLKKSFKRAGILLIVVSAAMLAPFAHAQTDSVCAVVKIEIKQELTLERQAFDANMIITNGLDNIPLENVGISVVFTDENGNGVLASSDPNHPTAKFFIRVDTMTGVDNISGTGTIAPSATADIHWLIIPAQGAAEGSLLGKLYFIGATLNYTFGGEPETVKVAADSINVKPLPKLTLDYFLERHVYADDAFTPEVEPAEPFTLGVRVKNNGQAVAQDVKIESAQPKIIENEQGLLIGFEIISSNVNGQETVPSLLVNLGQVEPNDAAVGRWQMLTTLSGEFTEFTAEFTHADELGGELTSLLEATNTHFLLKDVLVDVQGRDATLDFLADDGDAFRVYESTGVDTVVTDQSTGASLAYVGPSGAEQLYSLNASPTAGFMFVKLADPTNGSGDINRVTRSDGKVLPASNAWFSKTRDVNNNWQYFINFFDVNSTGVYTLLIGNQADVPAPPVLQFIPDRRVADGAQILFPVEASDPNGTLPTITAAPLPAGATFTQDTAAPAPLARYSFTWIPTPAQIGQYEITYTASDGVLSSSRKAFITVTSSTDTDGDGMDDAWEMQHFGTLDRDGIGDFDGDGVSDLQEFLNGTNPTQGLGPTPPVVDSPIFDAEVTALQPTLTVQNSTVVPAAALTYDFEVYSDEAMSLLVASATGVIEGTNTSSWQVTKVLNDNTRYYWRVRAYDGALYSLWTNSRLFVNTVNDAPNAFDLISPTDGSTASLLNPTFIVMNSVDVDEDAVSYRFEVFEDAALTILVDASNVIPEDPSGNTGWTIAVPLLENTYYYWRATATDEAGLSTQSSVARFFVNLQNDPPTAPVIFAPTDGAEAPSTSVDLVVTNSIDPDSFSITYLFEVDTVGTFDSVNLQQSPAIIETLDTTLWSLTGLVEDTVYYWRVKANDGEAVSAWSQASFFVNAVNSAPSTPTILNPGDGAWVATLTPALEVSAATDPENDPLSYHFELYSDAALTTLLEQSTQATTTWILTTPLTDNRWYFWRIRSSDNENAFSAWSTTSRFFVDDNGVNDTPTLSFVEPSTNTTVQNDLFRIIWTDEDPDSSATIALYYNDGTQDLLIADNISEDADGNGDFYEWNTSAIADGTYSVYAIITDEVSSSTVTAPGTLTITRQIQSVSLTTSPTSPVNAGTIITLSAQASGGVGTYQYRFAEIDDPGHGFPLETVLQDFATNNTIQWNSGSYYRKVKLQVQARIIGQEGSVVRDSEWYVILVNELPR